MTSQFDDMTSSSTFFGAVSFSFPSLVTGPSFMSISSLVQIRINNLIVHNLLINYLNSHKRANTILKQLMTGVL